MHLQKIYKRKFNKINLNVFIYQLIGCKEKNEKLFLRLDVKEKVYEL